MRQALINEGAPGADFLPVNPPTSLPLYIATAEAKALGLLQSNLHAVDGYVGFSSLAAWSYVPETPPAAGQSYFIATAEHEISEVLGRTSLLPGGYTPLDFFRYAAAGVRQLTTGAPSYFSLDGGVTALDYWNNFVTGSPTGDLGDWAPTAGRDASVGLSSLSGVIELTSTDLTLMGALGWISNSETISNGQLFVVSAGQSGN